MSTPSTTTRTITITTATTTTTTTTTTTSNEGHGAEQNEQPERSSPTTADVLPHHREDEGRRLWCRILKPKKKWRLFRPRARDNYGFIPPIRSNIATTTTKVSHVLRYGTEGTHYAVGYSSLFMMIQRFGPEHEPYLHIPGVLPQEKDDGGDVGPRADNAEPPRPNDDAEENLMLVAPTITTTGRTAPSQNEVDNNCAEVDNNCAEVDNNCAVADDNRAEADDNCAEADNNCAVADDKNREAVAGSVPSVVTRDEADGCDTEGEESMSTSHAHVNAEDNGMGHLQENNDTRADPIRHEVAAWWNSAAASIRNQFLFMTRAPTFPGANLGFYNDADAADDDDDDDAAAAATAAGATTTAFRATSTLYPASPIASPISPHVTLAQGASESETLSISPFGAFSRRRDQQDNNDNDNDDNNDDNEGMAGRAKPWRERLRHAERLWGVSTVCERAMTFRNRLEQLELMVWNRVRDNLSVHQRLCDLEY